MKKVHVVPHSHWDREWYFTIEDSNALLVEHLDFLIEYLESNQEYPYFVFDGQLSIVEEYLRFRPENKERLSKLIRENRIHVGPWYTQCDSLNTKLESVIRNLQYGVYLANKFGKSMNIGYLPDAFGQNAYLPSVFKDCEIDFSVLQRGVYNDQAKKGLNFNWIAPNGESIKSNYIFFGYGPGKFLEASDKYLDEKLMPMLRDLDSMSFYDDILLPSGGDQALIRTHFINTTKEINKMQDEYELVMSNYEEFMKAINFDDKHNIDGELYASQKSRMHRTIHSQRVDLKILNNYVEKLLIEQLEPLMVIASKLDIKLNTLLLDEMWKKMFDIHAHDSVGGCNSDSTNKKIMARLDEVKCMALGQINIISKKIAKLSLKDDNGLMVFNFSNLDNKIYKARIFTNQKEFKLFDNDIEVNLLSFSQEEIDGGSKIEVTNAGERQVKLPPYYQTDIELKLNDLTFGYKTLTIKECQNDMQDLEYKQINTLDIKTKDYSLNLNDNKLVINDLVTLGFELQSDVGDSYDFAYLEGETPIKTTDINNVVVFESLNDYKINFNSRIKLNDITLLIESSITLSKLDNKLNVTHNLLNNDKGYRLRVIFIKEILDNVNYSDSGFGIIKRVNEEKYLKNWKELKYAEKPQAIYPFERFFKVDDLAIYNSNVKEYEVLNNYVALTLIRTVSHLGQDDLSTRPGRASGINNVVVMTPDAEMLNQEFTFSYSLNLGNEDIYELYALDTNNYVCYQNQSLNFFENRLERFELPVKDKDINSSLNINLPNLNISSARVSLNNEIEYRLFNSKEDINVDINTYNLIGNKKDMNIIKTNDYITIKDDDVK